MTHTNAHSSPGKRPAEASLSHPDLKQQVQTETKEKLDREKIIHELQSAKNSEDRVKTFATLADTYGLDAILGLVFPEIGDATVSGLAGLYLLFEAAKADLGKWAYVKIASLQAADFFIGAIPIAGDIADYFFKANKWSAKLFEERTQALVKQARQEGVPEEEIAKITGAGARLPQLAKAVTSIYRPKTKAA